MSGQRDERTIQQALESLRDINSQVEKLKVEIGQIPIEDEDLIREKLMTLARVRIDAENEARNLSEKFLEETRAFIDQKRKEMEGNEPQS